MSNAALFAAAVASGKQGFNPLVYDNGTTKRLRAWFDPRDPSGYTLTAGRVAALRNIVSGVNAVEEAAAGPALGTGLAGGPCLVGNAASYLTTTEANILACWTASAGVGAHTLIVLAQGSLATNSGGMCGVGRADQAFNQSSNFEMNSIADSANCYTYSRTPSGPNVQWFGGAPVQNVPVAAALVWPGATPPLLRVNGVAAAPAMALTAASAAPPGAVTTPQRFALLARGRQNYPGRFTGLLGPVLVYAGALTAGECDGACEGLRRWYGLS